MNGTRIIEILLKDWERDFILSHFKTEKERIRATAEHILRNALAIGDMDKFNWGKEVLLAYAPEVVKEVCDV